MEFFDLRTAVMLAGVMSGLLAVVIFAAHYSFPKSVRGLRTWGLANIFMMFGGIGISLRDILPDFLSIVAAVTLIAIAFWLMWSATRQLLNLPDVPAVFVKCGLTVVILLLSWWTYASPNMEARIVLVGSIACVYYMSQAVSLWRRGRRSIENIFFVSVMGAGFGVASTRVVIGALQAGASESTGMFTPSLAHSLFLAAFSILALLHNMSFFFLATSKLRAELEQLAWRDYLTGALNRHAMAELAEIAVEDARRNNHPVSAIVFDLDEFKLINDTHGHSLGDQVLYDFAQTIKANKRATDIFARLGGDEFALILPETNIALALVVSRRIHSVLNSPRDQEFPRYTCSAGISCSYPGTTPGAPAEEIVASLLKRADEAMYRSKNHGPNRMELA